MRDAPNAADFVLSFWVGWLHARLPLSSRIVLASAEGLHHMGRANALEGMGRAAEADEATRAGLALDASLTWMRAAPK